MKPYRKDGRIKYDEASALAKLHVNRAIHTDRQTSTVLLPHTGPGLKLWGAIDYLMNFHKYVITRSKEVYHRRIKLLKR